MYRDSNRKPHMKISFEIHQQERIIRKHNIYAKKKEFSGFRMKNHNKIKIYRTEKKTFFSLYIYRVYQYCKTRVFFNTNIIFFRFA